jgi:hypothetical protein
VNPIYRAILEHVRENSAILTLHTDDDAIVQMFANHRGERGLRLTKFGLQTMQRVFVSYDVDLPADEVLLPKHLVALDKLAKTPYYFDRKHVVVFDHTIAVTLKLVGGRLSKLIDIES